MISFISGNVIEILSDSIVVNVVYSENSSVGYMVYVNSRIISSLEKESHIQLYIYHQFREDGQSLYGFLTSEDKMLFEEFFKIKGVGGKLVNIIFSNLSLAEITQAIFTEDTKTFQQISGIGQKVSSRIITEMKNNKKLIELGQNIINSGENKILPTSAGSNTSTEAISALMQLGYSKSAVTKVVKQIVEENEDVTVEEIILTALKHLSNM